MNDYDRIARVIEYLSEHQSEQPNLSTLAGVVRLSEAHFHRLFSRLVGITPKDFLQSLTLAQLKRRLELGESILAASLGSGLSGPSRAHDLCLTLEAASPGELKRQGEGWCMTVGVADSPFGRCVIGESPRGLCHLSFVDIHEESGALAAIKREWPYATFKRNDSWAAEFSNRIFHSAGPGSRLRAYLRCSHFQARVWKALLMVPEGALVTYGDLAKTIGDPLASRSVGTAVGRNPLAYLIPCHRVIRKTGVLGNYRWGTVRKEIILRREHAVTARLQ